MKKQINYIALMCITAILFIGLIAYELHRLVNVAIKPANKIGKYTIELPEEIEGAKNTELLNAEVHGDTITIGFRHNEKRSYQLDVYDYGQTTDSIALYDGDRLVGKILGTDTTQVINELIMIDND